MKKTIAFLVLLMSVLSFDASAQCRRMAKKTVKELAPFRFNGQLNSVVLAEGESAELNMVLRGGKKYRILTKGGRGIGKLSFVIYDRNKKVVFDNADHAMAQVWDFKNSATQNFTVEVKFPIGDEGYNDVTGRGCVALVVGFLDDN
jgi:hypothetical protein